MRTILESEPKVFIPKKLTIVIETEEEKQEFLKFVENLNNSDFDASDSYSVIITTLEVLANKLTLSKP